MKYFSSLVAIVATFFCVQGASAENLGDLSSEYQYSAASSSSVKAPKKHLKSSFELDYNFVDTKDLNNFGASFVFGGLVLTGSYSYFNELPVDFANYCHWSAGAGLNKRVYLLNFLFLEARIVADYDAVVYEMENTSPVSTGAWGAYGNARVGLKLFSNTCVTAGYKCRFADFKFNEEHMTEQLSVGLSFLF